MVSHSHAQQVDWVAHFDDTICSASVVLGEPAALGFAGEQLSDSFEGIDARVYRLTFAHHLSGKCNQGFDFEP